MCGVELVPVERLKPAGYNPRRADAERLALVRLSLSRLGFLLPIVATPDGEILSGHQRHAVAISMGARQVPVMFVDIPQERRRGLNILFNRAPTLHGKGDAVRRTAKALSASPPPAPRPA
jgi:ParB-like chromosome segregation protein Spo0J